MGKEKGLSFAGPLANRSIPELGASDDGWAAEDPAIFGGTRSQLPPGTVVELPEEGGYKVVETPNE